MDDHEKCLAAARSNYELGVRRCVAELQAIKDRSVRTGLHSFPGGCETHRIEIMIRGGVRS
ncbi:MAG: hypothetical protein M3228_14435 [Actinomycetota bacterium]|nr:hypothetical protein [Actinomycetota bacterium]